MTISVFLSYSRKDEAAARQLESDLERGRATVWRDAELRGGDPWWQKILEQIRACDVFVLALSNNGLASKPCRAELAYARDLGLPVLPVQIGPVDSLRTAAVGELQVLDYRQQSAASGIALLSELEAAARRKGPPPDPLPLAPPVPFAYLLRLGTAIEQEQLTPTEQNDLVGQLRTCLETEDDEGVKEDARDLLRALRRRSDVTYKHAGEIDALLAGSTARPSPAPSVPRQDDAGSRRSAAAATTAAGVGSAQGGYPPRSPSGPPPPGYGPPGGYGAPPPPGPGYPSGAGRGSYPQPPPPASGTNSRLPLLLLTGAIVVAGAVAGGALLFGQDSGNSDNGLVTTEPSPPPSEPSPVTTEPVPPTTAEDDLWAVLPGDFDEGSCTSAPLAGDGDVAALICGPAFTQPGPTSAQFNLYPAGVVDDVFLGDVAAAGVAPHAGGAVCPDFLGYSGYVNNGEIRGSAACFVGPDNASYLLWTDDFYGAEGVVTIPNGGVPGVYVLWNWWANSTSSAFGG